MNVRNEGVSVNGVKATKRKSGKRKRGRGVWPSESIVKIGKWSDGVQ